MSKCLAVVTENGLEPTAQTNNTLNAIKLAILQKQAQQGFNYNDEILITESGEFNVPCSGVYEVLCINGGHGAWVRPNYQIYSGASGNYVTKLLYLTKGTIIDVTIGAGGIGVINTNDNSTRIGGTTIFGDYINAGDFPTYFPASKSFYNNQSYTIDESGGGFGGGETWNKGFDEIYGSGKWWGAGGAAHGTPDSATCVAGNGSQGVVRLRFFNPEKAVLPTIDDTDLIPYIELLQRIEAIEAQLNINS